MEASLGGSRGAFHVTTRSYAANMQVRLQGRLPSILTDNSTSTRAISRLTAVAGKFSMLTNGFSTRQTAAPVDHSALRRR